MRGSGLNAKLVRYAVVGGAGAMGRITVRDLVETLPDDGVEILVADYSLDHAKALVEELRDPRVRATQVDVQNHAESQQVLAGSFVVINAAQYQLNLDVMKIAHGISAHYIDLGGLFHVTRQQLEWDSRFRAIGKLALLGMGAAPGITNILARHACDQLDTVREIHLRVGSLDATRYEPKPALSLSYSLKTILEEFSFQPAIYTRGQFRFLEPMSGDVPHRFPAPIGVRRPMYTIHSEVATLPLSFRRKGVKEVSFKIAFDPEFVDRVRFLRDLGMGSAEWIDLTDGVKVRPIDVIQKVAASQPRPRQVGKLKQYEVVRAVVKGSVDQRPVTLVADCHTAGMPSWGIGLDIDTGSPPSIAAQMLARGEIRAQGALPAELAVPPLEFFQHLKRRKMTIKLTRKSGWKFAT